MWLVTVWNICSLKFKALKYGQEPLDIKSKKLQVIPKVKERRNIVAKKKLQIGSMIK